MCVLVLAFVLVLVRVRVRVLVRMLVRVFVFVRVLVLACVCCCACACAFACARTRTCACVFAMLLMRFEIFCSLTRLQPRGIYRKFYILSLIHYRVLHQGYSVGMNLFCSLHLLIQCSCFFIIVFIKQSPY